MQYIFRQRQIKVSDLFIPKIKVKQKIKVSDLFILIRLNGNREWGWIVV